MQLGVLHLIHGDQEGVGTGLGTEDALDVRSRLERQLQLVDAHHAQLMIPHKVKVTAVVGNRVGAIAPSNPGESGGARDLADLVAEAHVPESVPVVWREQDGEIELALMLTADVRHADFASVEWCHPSEFGDGSPLTSVD